MTRSRIIAGKAVILIEAQDLVDKTLKKTQTNLNKFANNIGNVGENLFRTGFFGAIGSGALVSGFVKFDDAMRTLKVNLDVFGQSAEKVTAVMKPLEERIRSLAKATPFSPTQVAEAATNLAKGGFNAKQIIDSLQSVLDLARATRTELDFTAEFMVRTLTTYGISTERAADVASQLVNATRKGTLGIDDLEAAMRYSSGTADTLGVSLQKMLALFTILSNRGLVGSIAGTSTNTAFSQLVKKAEDLAALGKIDLVVGKRADGREALDVISSLQNLFKYADTLDFTKQQTLFQDVFNLRGARSVSAIRKQLDAVNELAEAISNSGDRARKQSEEIDAGLGGALRRLLSTVQNLSTTLSEDTQQALIAISNIIKKLVENITALSVANPALTTLVILSPGILLAAGVGLIALSKAMRVTAAAAGGLLAVYRPLANLISKGTSGQLSGLSAAFANKKTVPSAAFKPLKLPKPTVAATLNSQLGGASGTGEISLNRKVLEAEAKLQDVINASLLKEATARKQLSQVVQEGRQARARSAKLQVLAENTLAKAERNRSQLAAIFTVQQRKANAELEKAAALIKTNKERITALQREEKVRIATGRAELALQRARNKLASLEQDRESVRRSLIKPTSTREELEALAFREKGLTREIAEARRGLTKIRPTISPVVVSSKALDAIKEQVRLLREVNQLEQKSLTIRTNLAAVENNYIKQLTKGQDLLLKSNVAKKAAKAVNESFGTRREELDKLTATQRQAISRQAEEVAQATARARNAALAKVGGSGLNAKGPSVFSTIVDSGKDAIVGLRRIGFNFLGFGKTILSVLNAVRRGLFATFSGGLLTVIEGLFLFGDRLPGISTVLDRFAQAFSNAFKAIGNISTFAAGPLALFKASIEAFSQDRSQLGMQGLIKGMSLLASIVKNQLYLAWLRFKQSLGTVWGLIREIGVGLSAVFSSIVLSIGSIISSSIGTIGSAFSGVLKSLGFGKDGFTFEGGIEGLSQFVKQFSLLVANIPIGLASAFEVLLSKLDIFVLDIGQTLRIVLSNFITEIKAVLTSILIPINEVLKLQTGGLVNFDKAVNSLLAIKSLNSDTRSLDPKVLARLTKKEQEEIVKFTGTNIDSTQASKFERNILKNLRLRELEEQRQVNIKNINKSFDTIKLPKLDGQIQTVINESQRLYQEGLISAQQLVSRLQQVIPTPQTTPANFDQTITPTNNVAKKLQEARLTGLAIADAIVGSAASTRGNTLKFNKIDVDQLSVLKSIDANIQKGLKNEGVLPAFK